MIVTPVHDHGFPFGTNLPEVGAAPRGVGVHMSDIYGAFYKEFNPDRYDKGGEPNPLLLELGMAWEDRFIRHVREKFGHGTDRPPEIVHPGTGILFNPDVLIFNGKMRLGEIKLTFMSSKDWPVEPTTGFPPAADKYLTQMKLYCYALETPYACLMATFVNGNGSWAKQFGPKFMMWDIEFTARELKDEWQTFMGFAKGRKIL